MKKRIKRITALLCICISCVVGYFALNNKLNNDTKQPLDTGIDISSLASGHEEGTQVLTSASYADGYNSFKELIDNADLIVRGTVENVTQKSELAVSTTFKIDEYIKGDSQASIEIMELVSDHLVVGESYLLTLKPSYLENSYYIMGGNEGAFVDDNLTYTALDSDFQQDVDLSVNNELSNGVEINQILNDIINKQ